MKIFQKIIIVSAAVVLSAGCIKEDISKCGNVTLNFFYAGDNTDGTNVLTSHISKVDLYVFDAEGRFLTSWNYSQDELKDASLSISRKLDPGTYTAVAVGNAFENTEVTDLDAASLDQIYIQHPQWDGRRESVGTNDDNYIGSKTFTVPDSKEHFYETVELKSSHIDVDIIVKGLHAPVKSSACSIRIENANGQTSFKNETNAEQKGIYYPELEYDKGNGFYRTSGLRLFRMDKAGTLSDELCRHELVVLSSDGSEELYRMSVYDFLLENKDKLDVTRQEAVLPIEVHFQSIGVTVTVPDWYIEDIEPEL